MNCSDCGGQLTFLKIKDGQNIFKCSRCKRKWMGMIKQQQKKNDEGAR